MRVHLFSASTGFLWIVVFCMLGRFQWIAAAEAPPEEKSPPPLAQPVVRTITDGLVINGQKISYTVTASQTELLKEDGKRRASIFSMTYERSGEKSKAPDEKRPVMFAFNGGPGSSSVWLHIGMLGPKIVSIPENGTASPPPPCLVDWNPHSILDACDLVFVDPVSTGFSRASDPKNADDFHGLETDIESTGEFIRRWIDTHSRWGSPKYLLGESYGGIRVAGLSRHLQSRYGMSVNGVILLSSLLDFSTIQPSPGNDLSYLTFLPSFTGTALHHGKIHGNREELLQESRQFAFGEYASALLAGRDLPAPKKQLVAAKLAQLTGISENLWLNHNLRIDPAVFRVELLRAENRVIGRFDGRVAWPSSDPSAYYAAQDPSYSLAQSAFSSAMLDYLGREIGYKEPQPYEILTSKVQPWKWNAENEIVNVSDRLSAAMRDNPHLRVLVMAGHTDLATPPEGVAYSLRHLPDQIPDQSERITTAEYDGGHMFYLNPPDLEKSRKDLLRFLSR